jgi:hypothetical protein
MVTKPSTPARGGARKSLTMGVLPVHPTPARRPVPPIGVWMSVPAFRRRFRVKAADRAYAREIITADVQRMLARRADVSLLIEGEDLMCWTEGKQSAQEILDRLNLLADMADAMPAVGAIRHR